jgi:hypothetical protein
MMVIQHHSRRTGSSACATVRPPPRRARGTLSHGHRRAPLIHGVPHRIKYFEAVYDYIRKQKGVWMTTGEEIYEWYLAHPWSASG